LTHTVDAVDVVYVFYCLYGPLKSAWKCYVTFNRSFRPL